MASKLVLYQTIVFATMFVGYAFYAYNRKSVSFALPSLLKDGFRKDELGLIASSQNIAYAISKFLGGILADRISSKLLFGSGLVLSGVATLAFAQSASIQAFAILWFLNGFAQGAGWPACAKLLRQWYSPSSFGTWWSLLSASANISCGVAPFLSAYIIVNHGWRMSLIVAGGLSIVIGIISLLTLIDSPEKVGFASFGSSKKSASNKSSDKKETVRDLVRSPFLWIVSFCYMTVFCAKTSAVDWGQMYLIQDQKRSQFIASAFTSSLESGGFFGGIIAGWMTDFFLKRSMGSKNKNRGNPRMPAAIIFTILIALTMHLMCFNIDQHTSQLVISAIGFVMGAALYGPIAIYGVVATESAPDHLSGTAHAIVALAANVGAIVSGLPFSYIAENYSWTAIFILLEGVQIFTVLLMLVTRNMNPAIGKVKEE